MSQGTDYATMVLGNKGKQRPFSVLLLVLTLILILVRLPFMFSDSPLMESTQQTRLIKLIDSSVAGAYGKGADLNPVQSLGTFCVRVVNGIRGIESTGDNNFARMFSSQKFIRQVVSGIQILLWLILSLAFYRYMEKKVDDTVGAFILWMMVIAPAALRATGFSDSIFLAPFVCGVMVISIEIYDRGSLFKYALGGGLAGASMAFGFHNCHLLIPLLFAHFFSTREPAEGFFRLLFSLRFLLLLLFFSLGAYLFSPQYVPIVEALSRNQLSSVWETMHPLYLFGSSNVGNQFRVLYSSQEPLAMAANVMGILGPLATVLALFSCVMTLFSRDLGRFRPVAVYVLCTLFLQMAPGYPAFETAAELVVPFVLLLAVNILGQVNRFGYRFQKTVFVSAAVIFSLSPLWLIIRGRSPVLSDGGVTRVSAYMSGILVPGEAPVQIGLFFPAPTGVIRLPQPCVKEISSQAIFEHWAKTLVPVVNLQKQGAVTVVVNRDFLNQLAKKINSKELSERVKRISLQLETLAPVSAGQDEEFTEAQDTSAVSIRNL